MEDSGKEDQRGLMRQVLVTTLATIIQWSKGQSVTTSAFLLPQIQNKSLTEDIFISEEEGSWFACIFSVGSLCGALIGGSLSDAFGRKRSLLVNNVITLIGISLQILATNFFHLLMGRLLLGYATSSAAISLSAYITEISSPSIRGLNGSILSASYLIGFTAMLVLGAVFPWRWAIASSLFVSLLGLLGIAYIPESPIWLVLHHRLDEAKASLVYLRNSKRTAEKELKAMTLLKEERKSQGENFWIQVRRSSFVKPFLILITLLAFGIEFGGFPHMAFYTVTMLQHLKLPFNPYWGAVLLAFYRLLMSLVSMMGLLKISRRFLFFLGGSLCLCGHGIIGLSSYSSSKHFFPEYSEVLDWCPLIGLLVLYSGFNLGYGVVPNVMMGEIIPTEIRGMGCGLIITIVTLCQFVAIKIAPWLIRVLGLHGCFLLYWTVIASNMIFAAFYMPETRGLTLDEISYLYNNDNKKCTI